MTLVAVCPGGIRGRRRSAEPGRVAPRRAPIGRNLRRAAAGVSATLLTYAVLLSVSVHGEFLAVSGWTSSAAERLGPHTVTVTERGAVLAHEVVHALTWTFTVAPLPLAVSILLWLAHRDPKVYVRLAGALLLSGAAGLGAFAVARGWPVREASPIGDYLAVPSVSAGWYLLMALAVTVVTARIWIRTVVLLTALFAVTVAATTTVTAASSTADRPWIAVLSAVVVPFLAWSVTGRLAGQGQKQRPREAAPTSTAVGSPGRTVAFRARTRTPEPAVAPEPVPLQRAS
ncbi:hypothetical protein QF026_008180 [Streptomyces aurantiacus]|uniref:hypothetical protein n=1 Tax=Streptomyces aurantiacus TaxID=47760 RepID=UPI00278DD74B|nr:hypothetical protein [Streptomyces aurantiacus]MDQ0779714.1 hypothetical protein [Streptomyces aurantiacus]